MCFRKAKEKESINDCLIMFKHRYPNIVEDRIKYATKLKDLFNDLIQSAVEYGKNMNNTELIGQPGEVRVTVAEHAKYNLMLSMVKCQMEDPDGLFSFCKVHGLQSGETPQFEFKAEEDFLI